MKSISSDRFCICCAWSLQKKAVDSNYGKGEDIWFKMFHPEQQHWNCGIPYSIFSCKRSILWSVHGTGCRWNKLMEMFDSEFLVYVVAEVIGVKGFQFVFDGFKLVDPIYWHVSFDVAVQAFCACISWKVKIFCSFSVNLEVESSDYCPSIVNLSFP